MINKPRQDGKKKLSLRQITQTLRDLFKRKIHSVSKKGGSEWKTPNNKNKIDYPDKISEKLIEIGRSQEYLIQHPGVKGTGGVIKNRDIHITQLIQLCKRYSEAVTPHLKDKKISENPKGFLMIYYIVTIGHIAVVQKKMYDKKQTTETGISDIQKHLKKYHDRSSEITVKKGRKTLEDTYDTNSQELHQYLKKIGIPTEQKVVCE